jgi:hypothetical protein
MAPQHPGQDERFVGELVTESADPVGLSDESRQVRACVDRVERSAHALAAARAETVVAAHARYLEMAADMFRRVG